MDCKKCSKDLSACEYKEVAQWAFCLDCFQGLMDKTEAAPLPETAVAESTTDRPRCQICEKETTKDSGHDMLGLVFCQECYGNLVKRPTVKPRQVNEAEMESKPAVAQVRVNLRKPVQCHGCNRQIPVLGSKEFAGNSYCPDCYRALPEIKAQRPRPFPKADAEQTAADTSPETGLHCQACQREVLPENLETLEGFEICRACLATDSVTALDIARSRHRKRLAQMQREIRA